MPEPKRAIFEGQLLHGGAHVVLGAAAVGWCMRDRPVDGWLIFALLMPALHQGWVWLNWRLELHHKAVSRCFGSVETAFRQYAVGFTLLAFSRIASLWALSIFDAGSVAMPRWLGWTLGGICLVLTVVMVANVKMYFGFRRAFGIDHFDESYRGAPLVKKGLFRYFDNVMYTFVPAIAFAPACIFRSERGMVFALFNVLVLWAHFFGTERPDMRTIYGEAS